MRRRDGPALDDVQQRPVATHAAQQHVAQAVQQQRVARRVGVDVVTSTDAQQLLLTRLAQLRQEAEQRLLVQTRRRVLEKPEPKRFAY